MVRIAGGLSQRISGMSKDRFQLQYSLVKADTSGGHFLSDFKRFRLPGVTMT